MDWTADVVEVPSTTVASFSEARAVHCGVGSTDILVASGA